MNTKRTLHLIGHIEDKKISELLTKIAELAIKPQPISLFISSGGGDLAAALAFYAFVRGLKINLTTVAAGDVSSAAIVVWLAGKKRLVWSHRSNGNLSSLFSSESQLQSF